MRRSIWGLAMTELVIWGADVQSRTVKIDITNADVRTVALNNANLSCVMRVPLRVPRGRCAISVSA